MNTLNKEEITEVKQEVVVGAMSEELVSALRAGIKTFKQALIERRSEVLANYKLLHVNITNYLEALKRQEDEGTFFRAPNLGKFMGNLKPHELATIIVTKQNAVTSKTKIAVATIDDQILPSSELGEIPFNQLIMFAFFVQQRLEAMLGRRIYRSTYLREFLAEQELEINPRVWTYNRKRTSVTSSNIPRSRGNNKRVPQRKSR